MSSTRQASNKRKRDQSAPHGPATQIPSISAEPAPFPPAVAFSHTHPDSSGNDVQLAEALKQHRAPSIDPDTPYHANVNAHAHEHAEQGSPAAHETHPYPSAQYTMTVPASTESQFAAVQTARDGQNNESDAHSQARAQSHTVAQSESDREPQSHEYPQPGLEAYPAGSPPQAPQPPDGPLADPNSPNLSEHDQQTRLERLRAIVNDPGLHDRIMRTRKDNHKEVERRRRENINEGINKLAEIVPGDEKNKGKILICAIDFINQLKENEAQNIEEWTLQKMLNEQAIGELSKSNDALRAELKAQETELAEWREMGRRHGLQPMEIDSKASKEVEKAM